MAGYNAADLIRDFRSVENRDSAFKELYNSFYERIYYTCVQLVKDKEEAKDIVHSTFERLLKKNDDFDNVPEIGGFLFTTSRNLCFDHFRYLKKMTDGRNRLISLVIDEEDLINDQLDAEYLNEVKKLIESLPAKEKQAVELLFIERLKSEEAACKMGISVAMLYKRRNAGLSFIKIGLQTKFPVEVMIICALVIWRSISSSSHLFPSF